MTNDQMKVLEWAAIIIGSGVGLGFMIAAGKTLYKMKSSKDGFWRP
jgi:hypothetical protein